jgi:hypothetical protein
MNKKKIKNSLIRCFSLASPTTSPILSSPINNDTNLLNNNNNNNLLQNNLKQKCCTCCFKNHSQSHQYYYHQTRYNLNYFLKIKLKPCAISLSIILLYYLFSITLTFYNRMLFVTYKYPLSITIIHLIIKFLLSMLLRYCYCLCTSQPRILLNWNLYFKRIIPTGIASALDIGLSNWRYVI